MQILEKVSFLVVNNDSISKQAFEVTYIFFISPFPYHTDKAEYFYRQRQEIHQMFKLCSQK